MGLTNLKAYDEKGHIKIELYAYQLFIKKYKSENPEQILTYLKKLNILYCDTLPHSQIIDYDFDRQFAENKQVYHFMASDQMVIQSSRFKTKEAMERELLLKASPYCYSFIYSFFRYLLEDPLRERQSGRGIYVLMHSITDSYSEEHTSRDSQSFEIKTIKGWVASRFNFFWPEKAKIKDTTTDYLFLLHKGFFSADGDKRWFCEGSPSELSPKAEKAAEAICDLLYLTYTCHKNIHNIELINKLYNDYIIKYLRPYNSDIEGNSFIIQNSPKKVKFNFSDDYDNPFGKTKLETIFSFDRSPARYYGIYNNTNLRFSNTNNSSIGIEFNIYHSPHFADNGKKILRLLARFPTCYKFNIEEIINNKTGSFQNLNFKAFIGKNIAIPFIPFFTEPKVGVGYSFLNTKWYIPYGVEMYCNSKDLKKYTFGKYRKAIRYTIGWEHNQERLIENSISIKIGVNTWQARISK